MPSERLQTAFFYTIPTVSHHPRQYRNLEIRHSCEKGGRRMCSVGAGLAVGWASAHQSHRFHLFPQLRQCYPFRPFPPKTETAVFPKTFDAVKLVG
ncbi:TPA: hypothetical protein ACJJMM_002074 [Neisseria meningitidis]